MVTDNYKRRELGPRDELPRDNQDEKQLHRCRHCDGEVVMAQHPVLVHFFSGSPFCDPSDRDSTQAEARPGVTVKRKM